MNLLGNSQNYEHKSATRRLQSRLKQGLQSYGYLWYHPVSLNHHAILLNNTGEVFPPDYSRMKCFVEPVTHIDEVGKYRTVAGMNGYLSCRLFWTGHKGHYYVYSLTDIQCDIIEVETKQWMDGMNGWIDGWRVTSIFISWLIYNMM